MPRKPDLSYLPGPAKYTEEWHGKCW